MLWVGGVQVRVMQHVGKSLNVVHLYDAFEDDTHVHLLLELCRGGEVRPAAIFSPSSSAVSAVRRYSEPKQLEECWHGGSGQNT